MKLQEDEIFVGDRAYDVSSKRGFGRVIRITDDSIEVKFPRNNINVIYNTAGIQKGMTVVSLYWSKPLVVAPRKDDTMWARKQKVVDTMLDLVEELKDY